VSAFIKAMAEPYQWSDVVLCRAGATSLAELSAVGRPAVLVPFPHATDNHQEFNARALVDAGGDIPKLRAAVEKAGVKLVKLLVTSAAP